MKYRAKTQRNRRKSRLAGRFAHFRRLRKTQENLKTSPSEHGLMVLLLQVVGNVELWLVVGCHSPTEVADGEVSQISHAADAGSPLVDGIAIGENDDIATTQRLQAGTCA